MPRPPSWADPTLRPAELSKAQGQQPESDELDEPDTSDSEVSTAVHWRGVVAPWLPQAWGILTMTTPPPLRWA